MKLSITCCLLTEKLMSQTAFYCLILQAGKPSMYSAAFEPHWWWQPEYIQADCKLTEKLSLLCHLLEKNQTISSIRFSKTAVFNTLVGSFTGSTTWELYGKFCNCWTNYLVISKWHCLVYHMAWKQITYWNFWNSLMMKKIVNYDSESEVRIF
jgi:hypothetical protein